MQRLASLASRVRASAWWLALIVAWAWSASVIAFAPYGTTRLRAALALVFVVAGLAACIVQVRRGASLRRVALGGLLIAAIPASASMLLARPSNDRDWSADQARLPVLTRQGDRLVVDNVRNFTYRSTTDYTPRWEQRVYDLAALESAWFVVEPFSSFPGAAHTFLSFGFGGGEYLAVSVEIRKERGESFSPWQGLHRNYEVMYVFGDERDLIRLRTEHRRDTVYVYPVRATRADLRATFEDILARAQALATAPEFYNTAISNCTTNLADHANHIAPGAVPFSWHLLLPGHADARALGLGLIDFDGTLTQARERFRVNERAAAAGDATDFSERIRRP